jgi:hypothetical protein
MGVGADQRWPTVIGVFLVLGYMAVRQMLTRGPQTSNLYLNIMVKEEGTEALFEKVNARLLEHVEVLDFQRLDSRDGLLQLTYFIDCGDPKTLSGLIDDLKQSFPVVEVSFLQQAQVWGLIADHEADSTAEEHPAARRLSVFPDVVIQGAVALLLFGFGFWAGAQAWHHTLTQFAGAFVTDPAVALSSLFWRPEVPSLSVDMAFEDYQYWSRVVNARLRQEPISSRTLRMFLHPLRWIRAELYCADGPAGSPCEGFRRSPLAFSDGGFR